MTAESYESLRERAERAERLVLEYENGISWDTTCLNCAHLLDRCYEETVRAERAEKKVGRVRDLLTPGRSDILVRVKDGKPVIYIEENKIVAALDDEE